MKNHKLLQIKARRENRERHGNGVQEKSNHEGAKNGKSNR